MKLDLILENVRNRYSLGLLEESEGLGEKEVLQGKIMITEATMNLRKMLVEEGVLAQARNLLEETWTDALTTAAQVEDDEVNPTNELDNKQPSLDSQIAPIKNDAIDHQAKLSVDAKEAADERQAKLAAEKEAAEKEDFRKSAIAVPAGIASAVGGAGAGLASMIGLRILSYNAYKNAKKINPNLGDMVTQKTKLLDMSKTVRGTIKWQKQKAKERAQEQRYQEEMARLDARHQKIQEEIERHNAEMLKKQEERRKAWQTY